MRVGLSAVRALRSETGSRPVATGEWRLAPPSHAATGLASPDVHDDEGTVLAAWTRPAPKLSPFCRKSRTADPGEAIRAVFRRRFGTKAARLCSAPNWS